MYGPIILWTNGLASSAVAMSGIQPRTSSCRLNPRRELAQYRCKAGELLAIRLANIPYRLRSLQETSTRLAANLGMSALRLLVLRLKRSVRMNILARSRRQRLA